MTEIQRDLDPSALIAAIEDNTIGSIRSWTKWSRLNFHQDPDVLRTTSDVSHFIFNMVLSVSPATESWPAIDAAFSQIKERRVPTAWWVGPSNSISELARYLENKGLTQVAELTGMAVDLTYLGANAAVPPGFIQSKVNDADSLTDWCQIMTSVSGFPDFASSAWLEMYQEIGILDDPQWHLYLGKIDGKPVGTSSLFLGHGVAGIHAVTTLPEFRGRGIGSAMTLSPLIEARSNGYTIGVLFSSEMAVGIYRNLGFREYGKAYIYLWQVPESRQGLS